MGGFTAFHTSFPNTRARQRRQAWCIEGRVDRRRQFAHIAAVLILTAPVGDDFGRDLQVELESVDTITHAKRLIAAEIRRRQQFGAGGRSKVSPCQWKTVSSESPSKSRSPSATGVKRTPYQPISLAGFRRTEAPSARAINCEPRQMPRIGWRPRDGLPDEPHLMAEERQIVIDRHRATHEDQGVIRADIRRRGILLVEIGEVHFDVALLQRRLDQSQPFKGYVAENQPRA